MNKAHSKLITTILLSLAFILTSTSLSVADPGDVCGYERTEDCQGQCIRDAVYDAWLADGYCDDGTWGVYFDCDEFNMDEGDCTADCDNVSFDSDYLASLLGNTTCNQSDPNLSCSTHNYDGGDCIETCTPGVYMGVSEINTLYGNTNCDDILNCELHNYDNWDCDPGGSTELYDCLGDPITYTDISTLLGDGICDLNLYCDTYNFDNGDCTGAFCYPDSDGDSYGDDSSSGVAIDPLIPGGCPTGHVTNNLDCDDGDALVYPLAPDLECNGIDNNCNGEIDEDADVTGTWYQDSDGDGYGDPDQSIDATCDTEPDNHVADNTDCNDNNGDINPGALEICGNTVDEDCDDNAPECPVTPPSTCQAISDTPLEAIIESPSPILMLLMDDSGSMNWDILVPQDSGSYYGYDYYDSVRAYWQTQWSGYNGIYYDPDLDYEPWPDSNTSYGNADTDTPLFHPNPDIDVRRRTLNNEFTERDNVSIKWAHYYVWSTTENAPYLVNITGTNDNYTLAYYKVNSCGDGPCSNIYSYVNDLQEDTTPPADVQPARSELEERQNFANWYQYYRTRRLTAVASIALAIANDETTGLKIGLHAINHSLNMIDPREVDDDRLDILDDLYDVGANGWTPLRQGLEDVGDYLDDDDNGPFSSEQEGGACQQAYTIMMTDGYYNQSDPDVGNADGAPCNNGICTGDSDYDGSVFGDEYSNTLADVAMYYYERDLNDDLENIVPTNESDTASHQHMVTYSISFGLSGLYDPDNYLTCPDEDNASSCPDWPDVDEDSEDERSITDLWHAAVNGRGQFLQANNATQLAESILALISDVGAREGSGASIAVTSHELKQGTYMYQGTYNSSGWWGDLQAYAIDVNGNVSTTAAWSAKENLDLRIADVNRGHTDRRIYTIGVDTNDDPTGIEFTTASLNSDLLSDDQEAHLGDNDTARENMINFIRGDLSNDEDNGGSMRARVSVLGDIINSAPKYLNGYLYVGANDGMLHIFDASDGEEVLAYVPNLVYHNLSQLTFPDYNHRYFVNQSVFIGYSSKTDTVVLIGGLRAGGKGYYALRIDDIDDPGSEFTLDDILWEFPNPNTTYTHATFSHTDIVNNMGYSYSEAAVLETENSDAAVNEEVDRRLIFGNGYDSVNGKAVLYVLDPESGTVLHMIDTGYGGPDNDNCNGLSTPVFIDVNNNGKADFAYAGDLKGNVWKFDIRAKDPTEWDVAYKDSSDNPQPLFQATDSAGNPQPITSRLAIKKHCVDGFDGYIVLFGTGKFLAAEDLTDTSFQAVYAVWDWAAEWESHGVDPTDKYLGSFNTAAVGNLSNLYANSYFGTLGPNLTLLSQNQVGDFVAYAGDDWAVTTANEINWFDIDDYLGIPPYEGGNHVGWSFTFPGPGERNVSDPILWLDYLLMVSQEPSDTICEIGGSSYLSAFHYCSGAAPQRPFLDVNNDGEITADDTLGGDTPNDPDDDDIPNRIELEEFTTYAPVMIEDEVYFGPTEEYTVQDIDSGVLYWNYINSN